MKRSVSLGSSAGTRNSDEAQRGSSTDLRARAQRRHQLSAAARLRAASSTSALQPATKLCRGGEQNASLVLEPKWRRRSIDQIVTINDVGLLDRSGMIIPAAVQVTRGRRADP